MTQNRVQIEVTGDSKSAEDALRRAKTEVEEFAKGARKIGVALSAIGAIGAVALTSAIKGALAERQGINLLDAALRNVGTSYKAQQEAIEGVVAAQQKKTNFGDDEQREALQRLVALSGDYRRSLETLPLALDVAAGLQVDLSTASTLVGRALSGNTDIFARYGIKLREGATWTEAITALTQRFGGSAQAAVDPLTQLGNAIGNLKESFGVALLPAIKPVIEFLTKVVTWANDHPKVVQMAAAVALVATAFAAVNGPLLIFIGLLPALIAGSAVLGIALGPLLLAILGVELAIAAVVIAGILLVKHWDWVKAHLSGFVALVATVGSVIFGPIVLAIGALVVAGMFLVRNWETIKAAVERVWGPIAEFLFGVLTGIKTVWDNTWDGIKNTFDTVVNTIIGIRDRLVGALKAIVSMVGDPLAAVWSAIKSGVDNVIGLINGAIGTLNSAIDAYNKVPILPDIPNIPQIGTGGGGTILPIDPGEYGPRQASRGARTNEGGGMVTNVAFNFDNISISEARRQIGEVVREIVSDGGLGDVGLQRA